MMDLEWSQKKWESWAEVGIKIFPHIKKKETKSEVNGIEEMLGITNKKTKIIDVCCGWGRHCVEFAKRGYINIYGIDISEIFINYAKSQQNNNVKFIQKDLMKLNYKNKYDVLLSLWHSIGLYENEDRNLEFLNKIYSLLKPKGKVLIDVSNGYRDLQRMKRFSREVYIPGNKNWWYIDEDNILGLTVANFDINKKKINYNVIVHEKVKGLDLKKIKESKSGSPVLSRENFLYKDDYISGNRHWRYNHNNEIVLSEIRKNIDNKRRVSYQIFEGFIHIRTRALSTKRVSLRIYTKDELINLLRASGFQIYRIFGNFKMDDYFKDSPRLIVIGQKPNNKF